MARYNDETEATGQAIRDFAETIRLLATQLERHADFMAESELPTVSTTHWATARDAAEGLAKFAGALQNATIKARMMADLDKMKKQSPSEAKKRTPAVKKKAD